VTAGADAPGSAPTLISSRDNPLVKDLRKLSQESTAYRKGGRVWLEGDHLCEAALARGVKPVLGVFSEAFWLHAQSKWACAAIKNIVITEAIMREVSALESPAQMGFLVDVPAAAALQHDAPTVIVDRVQDAGNLGSILRSAAAFGFTQVIAMKGSAAIWSPKVLRAGMGAHFGLRLIEGVEADALDALTIPLVVTSSHQGGYLHEQTLPARCAWVMGHEGQGASAALMQRASLQVRIAQPGGEESLNVAAAAAICLYASSIAMMKQPVTTA
jgi:RNA methyltransferase, TrmH family